MKRFRWLVLGLLLFGPLRLAWSAENLEGQKEMQQADALSLRVVELFGQGKFAEAVPPAVRALDICKRILGEAHPRCAEKLNVVARLLEEMGDYAKALPLYQETLAIRKKVLGEAHPEYADSLNNLAGLYESMGDYSRALPLYRQALAIRKKVLGEAHPDYATSLNNLAALYTSTGDYAQALPLFRQALAIRKKVFGETHPDYATSLNNLAHLYESMGDYDQALPLFQQALAIRKKAIGEAHPEYADSLNNLAHLHNSKGDYAQALPLYQEALAIRRKALGEAHPDYAASLNNLAYLHNAMGDHAKALPLYRQATSVWKKALGETHPSYAASLNNLAGLYESMGDNSQALPLYQQALAIRRKALGEAHPAYANSLNNLAYLYVAMGDYSRALPLFRQALTIRKQALGEAHPEYAASLTSLAFVRGILNDKAESLSLFLQGQSVVSKSIENVFAIGTEQQKLRFVEQQNWGYHATLSLIRLRFADDPQALRAGLDLVLSRKGIVFDAQARQAEAIAKSLDPATRKLWDELAGQRAMLAKLLQNKPDRMSAGDYQHLITGLQGKITGLEGQLAGKSALVAQELRQRQITSREVAGRLGKDAILAEFVRARDYDWGRGRWSDKYRYVAFILHPDGKILLRDLGDAEQLEQAVQAALKPISRVGSDSASQQSATRALYDALWRPIAAAVGNAQRVILSPDGLLNLVPFAALQNKDGRYLVETRQIAYVTSGRDLARSDLGIKPESELYLAADPQFDLTTKLASQAEPQSRGTVRSANFEMRFSPLPGTAQEARQIPGYLSGKKAILTGAQATEESVLSARRPRVMHLATHGFFLADQVPGAVGTRGAEALGGSPAADQAPALPKGYENPLVRSGLAFAGANYAAKAQGERDGLLTALEVSGMDLHGTDLVTLSACETGKGEVRSGEGVFGLRRAFALAGASHLMMSLWPVSDAVTARQMQVFYESYGRRSTPAAALRLAQLATIAELRSKKGTAEPALWAPFIVQGARGK